MPVLPKIIQGIAGKPEKQKLELSHKANAAAWNLTFDLHEEIEKMKQWWRERIIYLDAEINGL